MSRLWRILLILAAAAVLAVAGWYGIHWVQLARADLLLASANGHIERANQLLSEVRLGELGSGSFTSVENINKSAEAAGAALPLLNEGRDETAQAAADARRARGLVLLPSWYPECLEKKELIANLRLEQIDRLQQTAGKLRDLYDSGAVIFTTLDEMDRLLGQFQAALGRLPGDPTGAQAQMVQIAQSMRQIQKQLDEAYKERDFLLLSQLSQAVASNASLAEVSAQLAEATAAGDQARAQQSAVLVENKLQDAGIGRDYLDLWWQQEISPLENDFNMLQSRQKGLDAEAAEIYERNAG